MGKDTGEWLKTRIARRSDVVAPSRSMTMIGRKIVTDAIGEGAQGAEEAKQGWEVQSGVKGEKGGEGRRAARSVSAYLPRIANGKAPSFTDNPFNIPKSATR